MNLSFMIADHSNKDIPIIHAHVNETLFMNNIETLSKLISFICNEESLLFQSRKSLTEAFSEAKALNMWSLSIILIEWDIYIVDTLKVEKFLSTEEYTDSKPLRVIRTKKDTAQSLCI